MQTYDANPTAAFQRASGSVFPLGKAAAPRYRPSFTLIELLVAIGIMGVLVGMVLFALAGARTDAEISLTQKTVGKINAVILEEWEAFRYRAARIDIDPAMLRPQKGHGGQPLLSPREGARVRMIVLRDLMRMEMPDRWTDILYPPTGYKAALLTYNNSPPATRDTTDDTPYYAGNAPGTAANVPGQRVVPGKLNSYRLQLAHHTGLSVPAFASPTSLAVAASPSLSSLSQEVIENQGAELLYMIVAASNRAGAPALESFRPTEIGDTDGDGLLEFVDAWGNPIRWIRWPSGFSLPSLGAGGVAVPHPLNQPYNLSSNSGNSDAMDPIRTDWRWGNRLYGHKPWLLVPLVVSAGPDGVFDLAFDTTAGIAYATQTWTDTTDSPVHSQAAAPYYFPDPYIGSFDRTARVYTGLGLGTLDDNNSDGTTTGAVDNITSYSLILE